MQETQIFSLLGNVCVFVYVLHLLLVFVFPYHGLVFAIIVIYCFIVRFLVFALLFLFCFSLLLYLPSMYINFDIKLSSYRLSIIFLLLIFLASCLPLTQFGFRFFFCFVFVFCSCFVSLTLPFFFGWPESRAILLK